MIEFIAATYNEEKQIIDLIENVYPWVDRIHICDDGSTDRTVEIYNKIAEMEPGQKIAPPLLIEHTGLPETVKAKALTLCQPDSWVVMLDCDERIHPDIWYKMLNFANSEEAERITHVWFSLHEFIDGSHMKSFQKCRFFKASAAHFSDSVHVDDTFDGQGAFYGWSVIHSKTTEKQIMREKEYIQTYKRLIAEGKMTPERMREVLGNHYFIRE